VPDVSEGGEDVGLCLGIPLIQRRKHLSDLLPFGGTVQPARILHRFDVKAVGDVKNFLLFYKGKGPDNRQAASEQILLRYHGTDVAAIEKVEEKGFKDIVLMMAEGNFCHFSFPGQVKQPGPPLPAAVVAGAFSVLRRYGPYTEIGSLNQVWYGEPVEL
jgi:hypothetical protein